MSMVDKELSIKEKEAIDELERRIIDEVPPHLKDDKFLYLRFLRARNFNINLSEDMLRNHLIWRRVNGIDNLLKKFDPSGVIISYDKEDPSMSPLEKMHQRMKFALHYLPIKRMGFDKDGCPVVYFDFGGMDSKGITKCCKKQIAVNAIVNSYEQDVTVMKTQSEKLGKPIEQWIYILDFTNYTFAKATHKQTLEALILLFTVYEANYPERLKIAFVINASLYFNLMFAVIKPLLTGATISKIFIFGKDGWKEELLKHIHEKDLPTFLGGTKTDPDGNPLCNTIVRRAVPVPEELYLSSNLKQRQMDIYEEFVKATVGRMSKAFISLEVVEPGSTIEWEIETDGRDIGLQLLYKDCDGSTKEIIPLHRIDPHSSVSEVGAYQCEFSGTYIMVFDNSYSWIQQKNVYYRLFVVSPKS